MSPALESWLWWMAARLLDGSVYGAVVIALVWVACRQVRLIPASARAVLWWLASLKLLVALLPVPSFDVAVLPASNGDTRIESFTTSSRVLDAANDVTTPAPEPGPMLPTWLIAVVGFWVAGVAVQALQLFAACVKLRGMVRRSSPGTAEEAAIVGRLAGLVALRTVPTVRLSPEIHTPMVVGMVRPTVLLPAAESAALSPHEREMAVCHELVHIRRRDLACGWIPALAGRLFFFHPLARLAAREYVAVREAACDALVVQLMGVAPRDYGEMLVRLGVGRFGSVLTANGSSPSMSSLKRRLHMLHDLTATRSRRAGMALFAVLATATLLPFQLTAKSAQEPAAAPTPPTAAPARNAPTPPAVAAAQNPTPKASQARPVTKATPADEEELRKAVAEQRDSMREMERSLAWLRKEFEQMLARAEAMRQASASDAAQRGVREPAQAAAERQRLDRISTQEFLEERLRVLVAEKEETDRRLRALAEEIEAVRQQLNRAR